MTMCFLCTNSRTAEPGEEKALWRFHQCVQPNIYLIEKSRGDRSRIFLTVPTDRKFYLNIKIKPFYCRVGGQAQEQVA